MIKALLLIFLLASCGERNAEYKQCFTREDAIRACMVDEMRNKQIDDEQARLMCEPLYLTEGCHYL